MMMGILSSDIMGRTRYTCQSGIRLLLVSIEKSVDSVTLVENFEACVFNRPTGKQRVQQRNHGRAGSQNQRQYTNSCKPSDQKKSTNRKCIKSGESNHATFDCKHKEQIKCHFCGFLGHKQSKCPNQWENGNDAQTFNC